MAERNEWADKGEWADPDKWGPDGWDQDSGAPTTGLMSRAVQVWALLQQRVDVTVAEAAKTFNVPSRCIQQAVEDHPWMYLEGPDDVPEKQTIGHDGE